jgi:uncharacterized protein YndB with AHSA1/START domain
VEHVTATATISAPPARLWDQIGSFQGVGAWHPMLATVQGEGEHPGALRKATGADGSEQTERLIEVNPSEHYYRYVMEDTAMPVTDYSAEFRVRPSGAGASVVEWSADFEVTAEPATQAVDLIQGFLGAGLRKLQEQYG